MLVKTLNKVVDIVGLSRRAIQEYEVAGLAQKPNTKTQPLPAKAGRFGLLLKQPKVCTL